jgi:hypothetical protein
MRSTAAAPSYGSTREARGQGYVLRVPSNFYLTVARGVRLTCKRAAATLAGARRGWEVRSAGTGAKGQRWYAWAWLSTASSQHYLLIRRHLASGELAFHYCFARPASAPPGGSSLVTQVCTARRPISTKRTLPRGNEASGS